MAEDKISILPDLSIAREELRFAVSTAGGPGGQHVNRSQTRVELRFDLEASQSLSPEQKEIIRQALPGRISRDDVLRVVSLRHRSQRQNRQAAEERFCELLREALTPCTPRKATRPSRQAKENRLQQKRVQSLRKKRRRPPSED